MNRKTSEKKSILYHNILSTILKSLKESQDIGIAWEMPYRSGLKKVMKLYFPVCLCVVDMKGARQLCGMYDSSALYMKRPCISCDCDSENLDNGNFICNPVLDKKMKSIILDPNISKESLQSISQHKNTSNAFFSLNTGGWKYGIWGLCPSELLHQFYEGIVPYLLEEFFFTTLKGQRYEKSLCKGVQRIIDMCKNLGCKQKYPSGVFSMGITKFNKMKGEDKFGCVFHLCLFLHTDLAKTKYFENNEAMPKETHQNIQSWLKLFEKCLYYHDWAMQTSFSRANLLQIQSSIKDFHLHIKKLLAREGKGIAYIPKIHELLHVVRNILWHGPAIGYDTRPAESNLRIHKRIAQNTQRQISCFNHQTANRLFEKTVINQAFAHVQKIAPNKLCQYNSIIDIAPETTSDQYISTCRNTFYAIYDCEGQIVQFFKDQFGKSIISNLEEFDCDVKGFLRKHVFSLLNTNERKICVQCYSTVVRKGISFKGYSTDIPKRYPGWANIQWVDPHTNEPSLCPAKILFFMNLSPLNFKDKFKNLYQNNCKYAVIHSLTRTPCLKNQGTHLPICTNGFLEKNRVQI